MSWTGVCLFTINIGSFVPILTLATSLRKLKNNYINVIYTGLFAINIGSFVPILTLAMSLRELKKQLM